MATKEKRAAADATQESEAAARAYFEELERNVPDAQLRAYAPEATVTISGLLQDGSREDVMSLFDGLRASFPDFALKTLDVAAQGELAAVRWQSTGTFAGPAPFNGFAPTGARITMEGVDFLRISGGKIVRNDAYMDGMTMARQLGLMPPQGSAAETRMTKAMNAKTGLLHRVGPSGPEQVAEGVWIIRGGFPARTMNVYLVSDGDGVLAFDAGIKGMENAIASAAASLGGLTRVVLGHAHQDHRGAAPGLGVDVFCHEADKADAEGDGGYHTFDFSKLKLHGRILMPRLLKLWDGGPVQIAGTLEEGDDVAGFQVVHIPGHSAGMIALWRESDRLALTTDCFYTLDPQTGIKGEPRLPHPAFNPDHEQARASLRKVADLEPAAAWPGHADAVTGDVGAQLRRAADTT